MRKFCFQAIIYSLFFIAINGCANTSTFTMRTNSIFSPNYQLNNGDNIFISNDENISQNDLLFKNIKHDIDCIFNNLGYNVVNNISEANYLVAVNYGSIPKENVSSIAIPQYQTQYQTQNNIVGGATKNNFFLHGYTTTNPMKTFSGFDVSTYHYTTYFNHVGFTIYGITRNKKKESYDKMAIAIAGWDSSSQDILQRLNLVCMVLKDLLIAKPLNLRNYNFVWEDNILKSCTWTPINN